MTPLILAAAIAFVAFVVRGFTGFGSALVMTPLLALVFDVRLAVVTTSILGVLNSSWLTVHARRDIDRRVLARVLIVAVPGIVLGGVALAGLHSEVLRRALGTVIVVFGARLLVLVVRTTHARRRWDSRTGYLAGALSGLLGGAFGTSGPPLLIFLENQMESRRMLRATILAALFSLDVVRLTTYLGAGLVTGHILRTCLAMAPAAVLGAITGSRLHLRSNERLYRIGLGILLLGTGSLLVIGG